MRVRLAAMLTAAVVLLPAAGANADLLSSSPQPAKKCPEAMDSILDHCD